MAFYAIYSSSKTDENDENEEQYIFTDKKLALLKLKTIKDARLNTFKTNDEAVKFSQDGFQGLPVHYTFPKLAFTSTINAEKSAFRAPKSQELVQFRKLIETGQIESIEKIIWENPRYLVGSGDTPSILKEGTRYNAIHVTALSKQSKICELILETISKPSFIQLLHGKKNLETCQEVSMILLDLYLNMPEKGRSDTPLHMAVKYGAVEVVEILISYPVCKMLSNSDGFLPKDVICSRISNSTQQQIDDISNLLKERFYVPVIRSIDNSTPPIIGEPFSPKNPPNLNSDPLSPEMEIQAYAGPMDKEQAQVFRRRWKTPPRIPSPNSSPIPKSSYMNSPRKFTPIKLNNNNSSTPMKITRRLFENCDSISKRATEFFTNYRDRNISIDDSLNCSNNTFSENICDSPSFYERRLKITDTEKGFEVVGRDLAREQNVGWKEYWQFLGSFVNLSSNEGLQKFEEYLKEKVEKVKTPPPLVTTTPRNKIEAVMNGLCSAFNDLILNKDEGQNKEKIEKKSPNGSPTSVHLAYLTLEKSCQVFAKRMTKTILNNIENTISINDTINSELNRLRSYKDDFRFLVVDFHLVHSRFANLIVAYLKEEGTLDDNGLKRITQCFEKILLSKSRLLSDDLENKLQNQSNLQVKCLANFILEHLNKKDKIISPEKISTEIECTEIWCNGKKCDCVWNPEQNRYTRNIKLRNKRNEVATDVSRRLFDLKTDESKTDIWKMRSNKNESLDEELLNDEDFFYNADEDNSDDDVFYTPPESPTSFLDLSPSSLDERDDSLKNYHHYILGDEPSKTDVDVLNAISDKEIDRNSFPHIYKWRSAVLRFSTDERESFESESIHRVSLSSPMIGRKALFLSPKTTNCVPKVSRSKSFSLI